MPSTKLQVLPTSPDGLRAEIQRLPLKLERDDSRVITLPFMLDRGDRIALLFQRVSLLSDEEVEQARARMCDLFSRRHRKITELFEEHYHIAARQIGHEDGMPEPRRQLIGSLLTMEYSISSAALFNPSIVPHVDQSGLEKGSIRFLMSLRATGEGHISSIVFRTGVLDSEGLVKIDEAPHHLSQPTRSDDRHYHKALLRRKLIDELKVPSEAVDTFLSRVRDRFTRAHLDRAVSEICDEKGLTEVQQRAVDTLIWLIEQNYQIRLKPETTIGDVVLFPRSASESRGIEDLRLVRFVDDDESVTYFGTYTAYNGFQIMPMLMETTDFQTIDMHTLNGACARNKGMALFPRRIGGHYVMCSRIDGENLFIMYSDLVHFWESAKLLTVPVHPWELMQIGNCGSPIETEEGWLLLTHGVGPMRRYCIGAMLLDLDDPLRIIGHLPEPLLVPAEDEREGYVPNVVYSCGSMVHRGQLFLPYASSDTTTRLATISMDQLLNRLLDSRG
ncbi:MAG: glycoside hydrolase family 130 protein [Phycisphaeraceae bacterium]|nr:glycoside hydrolase family 130 protein [Phycisphaeraceae bacterium]